MKGSFTRPTPVVRRRRRVEGRNAPLTRQFNAVEMLGRNTKIGDKVGGHTWPRVWAHILIFECGRVVIEKAVPYTARSSLKMTADSNHGDAHV